MFRNSLLYQHNGEYFNNKQYLLGDSAFQNTTFMVSSYRKPAGGTMNLYEEKFNTALARPRVLSEHCIGIWKGRFPFLKGIRMKITDDTNSLKHILRMIDVCVILHNFLLEQNDEAPVDWMDVSRDDDDDEEEPDGADRNIQPNQLHDQKRQELRDYIADYYVY